MSYESSYETGGGPFRPNKDRGSWSSPSDFLFACICNAFRMDVIYGIAIIPLITNGGIFMMLSCLVNVMIYAIPIVFIQSFLGQFSSTGFISVFRIAPLFKGLGYVGLTLNLTSLAFYSVFAAVPLLYFLHSFQPTLPWSCEGIKNWMVDNESDYGTNHCNFNYTELDNSTYIMLQNPSVEFFLNEVNKTFSFPLFGCLLLVWTGIAIYAYNTTETIGKVFRYSVIILISLLVIVFIRMIFIPGIKEGLAIEYDNPKTRRSWHMYILVVPMVTLATFGPGWGTILTMASFNKFKTNISRNSWVIAFSQVGVLVMIGLVCMFTEYHLTSSHPQVMAPLTEVQWISFLTIPSTLATLEWPHMWTWMFLSILFIGSFNLVLVQLFSVLTALFDEFEHLRPFRREIIFGMTGILALLSASFCSEDGILFIELIANLTVASQSLINLLVLIVVLWVYGRERFQRDVEFMTSQVYATWKVYIVRFVTPIYLVFALLVTVILTTFSTVDISHLLPVAGLVALLPWLALPAFCIYRLMQTSGTIGLRFQRCTKPTDWYPIDPDDRQRYEETYDNPESSHPLTTIVL